MGKRIMKGNNINEISQSLEKAFYKSASILNLTDDKNIQRHILFSLSNRIQIIKHNYEYLEKEGYLNEMEQIDDDIIPILNSHLNSIYIHLSGVKLKRSKYILITKIKIYINLLKQ